MSIGYGFENEADFRSAVERQRERIREMAERISAAKERGFSEQDAIREARAAVGGTTARDILDAATYDRLNPQAKEPPSEPASVPGRTMRLLPAEDQSLARSIALSAPPVGPAAARSGPLEAPPEIRPAALPERTTAQDVNRRIFDRLRALDLAGAWRERQQAARDYPELFETPQPLSEREFEPGERTPQAEPKGQVPVTVPPPTRRAPAVTSPLSDLASRYGYGRRLPPWPTDILPPESPGGPPTEGEWQEVQVDPNAVYLGGSPPWVFDEAYGGPNPNYRVVDGKVYRRVGPGPSPGLPPGGGRARSPIQALLEAASQDVSYLRGEPFQSKEEQAMIEGQKARIRANFNRARQEAIDRAGAYNMPLGPALAEIDRQEQQALAEVDQGFTAMAAQERRSRLAEARNLLSYLEQLERARMMEAMGIEQALDEGDFARVAAILQAATGGQAGIGSAANVSGNILQYALGLGGQARQALGQSMQGLQDLSTLYWLARRDQGTGA